MKSIELGIFQGPQQQALAESERTQEEQLVTGLFQQRDLVRAVRVIELSRDNGIEITDIVGEFHG